MKTFHFRLRFVECLECLKECGHEEEFSICTKDVTRLPARTLTVDIYSQSQGHHTIDRLEERGLERGSTRRSSLKGREREPFQRQRWGNFWETGWSAYGLFRAHRYHLELTERNSTHKNPCCRKFETFLDGLTCPRDCVKRDCTSSTHSLERKGLNMR